MKIKIKNSQRKIPISEKKIAYLAKKVLRIKGIKKAELGILFAGSYRIRALNKKFRKVDRATDVLAFNMREVGKADIDLYPEILGDIIICPEVARRFSKIYRTSLEDEIQLCLVHGLLHLLGYDDSTPKKRAIMEREQVKILKRIAKR